MSDSVSLDTLLSHRVWVRTLARRLVADDGTADDVVQEAWLAALRSPPRRPGSVRGWLARVVRNAARQRDRSEGRRAHWESRAVRSPGEGSVADTIARAEAHECVVRAVMSLDDPYRATILLRFFEDLPPRDVARRMEVPVETVRTRTRRALGQLRRELEQRETTGGRFAVALLPLLVAERAAPSATAATAVGGLTMGTLTKAAVAVAVGAVLAVVVWKAPLPDLGSGQGGAAPHVAPDEPTGQRDVARRERRTERAGNGEASAGPAAQDTVGEPVVAVTVLGTEGAPLSDVRVVLFTGSTVLAAATTGDDGTAQIVRPAESFHAVLAAPGRPVMKRLVGPDESAVEMRLLEGAAVRGLVRVDGGVPPESFFVTLRGGRPLPTWGDLPAAVWRALAPAGHVPSVLTIAPDGDGRFAFEGLPEGLDARLGVPPGYVVVPGASARRNELLDDIHVGVPEHAVTLDVRTLPRVEGRVMDAAGKAPVPQAVVEVSAAWTNETGGVSEDDHPVVADPDGRFSIPLLGFRWDAVTVHVTDGLGRGGRSVELGGGERSLWDAGDVRVGALRTVEVLVVDAAGEPLPGAAITRPDDISLLGPATDEEGGTVLTLDPGEALLIASARGHRPHEFVAAAGVPGPYRIRLEAEPSLVVGVRLPAVTLGVLVRLSGRPGFLEREETPADFAVGAGGWLQSDYRDDEERVWFELRDGQVVVPGLRAGAEVTVAAVDMAGVARAEETVCVAERRATTVSLAVAPGRYALSGTVRDEGGEPIGGARVTAVGDARGLPPPFDDGVTFTTLSDGTFRVAPLAVAEVDLVVTASGLAPERRRGVSAESGEPLEVTLLPTQDVVVTVVDATGTPVTSAAVSMVDPVLAGGGGPGLPRFARSAGQGVYRVRAVPPREVRIAVRVAGTTHRFRHDGRVPTLRVELPPD